MLYLEYRILYSSQAGRKVKSYLLCYLVALIIVIINSYIGQSCKAAYYN